MAKNTSTGSRRAVGYVRISRDRDDETSTETQRQRIEAYASAQGATLADVVVEPGRSAFKDSRNGRPGLRKALGLIEAGAANELVVWKIDRCSRNALDLLTLVRDLEAKGAAFASVTESFDTSTPIGRTMLTIIAALAELESATKSERTTAWHEHRRSIAAVPAAAAPRGYWKPSKGKLEIDPVEGPLVKEAVRRALDGASLRSVVRWLASEGLTTTQRGLTRTLMSPTIAALVDVGGGEYVRGDWPALVERTEWEELRGILGDPERTTNRSGGERRFALAGIVRCWCGGSMRGKNHPRGARLTCLKCSTGIRYAEVERLVDEVVLRKLDDATWRAMRSQGRGRDVAAEAIEEKIAGLMRMMAADELSVDEFRMIKLGLEGQLAASTAPPLSLPEVESVRDSWTTLSVEQRRLVYVAVVERLEIGPATIGARSVDTERILLDLVD